MRHGSNPAKPTLATGPNRIVRNDAGEKSPSKRDFLVMQLPQIPPGSI
jgi:hypothetical protein